MVAGKGKASAPPRVLLTWRDFLPILAVVVVFLLAATLVDARQYQRMILLVALWGLAGASWNIIAGYAGQPAFGDSVFVGIGAYTAVFLLTYLGVTPWLGMLAGGIVAVLAALLIGLPSFRLAGVYFGLATLAYPLALIVILDFLGFVEVIIPFKPQNPALYLQFTDPRHFSYVSIGFLAAAMTMTQVLEKSRFGFAWRAVRQNQAAAEAMGINTWKWKMIAFMISSFIAAIMGVIYVNGVLFLVASQSVFGLDIVVRIISIALVGGMGSVWGPVLGSLLLVPMGEVLDAEVGDQLPGVQNVVFGMALVLTILFAPEGLYWRLHALCVKLRAWGLVPLARPPAVALALPAPQGSWTGQALDAGDPPGNLHLTPSLRRDAPPILRVEGVSVFFGGLRAVDDVSFQVPERAILGIIGPNGAGKTTLFNALNGYIKPDRGRVWFQNHHIANRMPHSVCSLGIGRTFQVSLPFPRMTVVENVMVAAFTRARNTAEALRISHEMVQRLGLAHKAYAPVTTCVIYEMKLLELCRAMATRPKLVLLDEPLAGLTFEEIDSLTNILLRIRGEAGTTLVVIEHNVRSLVGIADWMVALDHGRKIAEGSPEEVTQHPAVVEAYLGTRWAQRAAG